MAIVKEVHLSEDNQMLTVKTLTPEPEEEVIVTLTAKNNPEVRLNIRVDDDFRRQLKADAALRGITLSDLIRELGEEYLRQKESHDKTPSPPDKEPTPNDERPFTEDPLIIEPKKYRYFYGQDQEKNKS